MSTRCRIGYINDDGFPVSVYCHFDGYPARVGRTLAEHYATVDRVKALTAHGDMACLRERVDPIGPHTYERPEPGVCVFYERDRGEDPCPAIVGPVDMDGLDYAYLLGVDGTWLYRARRGEWSSLAERLAKPDGEES